MKLDISNIKSKLYSYINTSFDLVLNEYVDSDIKFTSPVHVNAVITNTDDGFYIDGSMEVSLDTVCYRCLRPLHYHSTIELHDNLNDFENESGTKVLFKDGNQVYLDKLIRTDLILSLPYRYLCNENCGGIDYKDSNSKLNGDESIDPRFEVLKKYFDK